MQPNIKALAHDPSPQVRAELSGRLAQGLQDSTIKLFEMDTVVDVLRILARDLEVQVRRSLALSLCHSMVAPHDVIMRLANDVADVAVPILQFSALLTDEDLTQLVDSSEEIMKLVAIAKRDTVSDAVATSLLKSGEERVIYTLFKNKGANISDDMLKHEWSHISANENLLETLVQRGDLSIGVAEKLYNVVSLEMKGYIASAYRLPQMLVEESLDQQQEVKILNLSSTAQTSVNEKEVDALVHQLFTGGRLSYSIVIRALCNGDFAFFEAAMSRLACVPKENAHILIYDSGALGFRAFYEKAKFPPAFYDAIHAILRIGVDIKSSGSMTTGEFQNSLVTRIQSEGLDYSIENMHYLLSLIMRN